MATDGPSRIRTLAQGTPDGDRRHIAPTSQDDLPCGLMAGPLVGIGSTVTQAVLNSVTRYIWLLAMVLAGCAATPQTSPSLAAPSSAVPQVPAPGTGESLLDTMLPIELGGVELHTFAVGEDTLGRLAAHLKIGVEELETRFASDHGARFLQMYALRAPGVSGSRLVEAWTAVAYPPDVPDATISEESVAGRFVTMVSAPSAASRLGTYYVYDSNDALIVVQAFDLEVAAEALGVLP